MKIKEILPLLCIILPVMLQAQSPRQFNWQSILRNSSGEVIANQTVGIEISIRNGTAQGTVVFRETHSANTNSFGMVELDIGSGTPVTGSISSINWGSGKKYLEIKLDASGGSNYISMGTSRILSNPYSLHARETYGITSLTTAQIDTLSSPWLGMMVMNSDTRKINYYDGYGWIEIIGIRQTGFNCGEPLLDARDGQYYNTVEINNKCWMAENLNYGVMIPGTDNQSDNGIDEKYCYQNNPGQCNNYGGLYQWRELMRYGTTAGAQGICPDGWHVPTDAEWTALINATGGPNNAGTNLVQGGGSGFEALMGGYRNLYTGYPFLYIGSRAYFWSSTQLNSNAAYDRYIVNGSAQVFTEQQDKLYGLSLRCVRD